MNLPSKNLKIDGPQLSGLKEIFIVKGTLHYPEKSYLRKRFDSRMNAQKLRDASRAVSGPCTRMEPRPPA